MNTFSYEYSPYTGQDGKEIPAFEVFNEAGEKIADTNENLPVDQQEKMAVLLSTAPEMLAMLEEVQKYMANLPKTSFNNDALLTKIEMVIAHAKGKQKPDDKHTMALGL